MKKDLLDVLEKIDCNDYTLKEITLYFERFDGYTLKIETTNYSIKIKIDKFVLPHILGLQYAYGDRKDNREYKGNAGFEKLKNGRITTEELRRLIKVKPKTKVGWKMIERRIEYLPVFLNTLERRTRFKIIAEKNVARNSSLKGKYAIFKTMYENGKQVFPMISLKEINDNKIIIETFIVEDSVSFLGGLEEENVLKMELVSPLDKTNPQTIIKEKVTVDNK